MAIPNTVQKPSMSVSRRVDQRFAGVVGVVLLIAVLVRPMVIGRTFVGWDWYPHQWYVWHQSGSLRANGFPSLFAHSTAGVFSPFYAFYGGTLYVLAGALTVVVGNPGSAMVIMFVLGFAAAYGGWFWLARQAGLGIWTAHAPAVLFVTGPYYLALIYATGGFAEFIGVSMIPLMLASGLAVLRADRLRFGPAALLAISTMLFTGSHNITLLWGLTVLLIVGAALAAAVPALRRMLTRRAVLRVLGIAVPAVLVNGWFLLPDAVYQSHTAIANWDTLAHDQLKLAMRSVRLSEVLSLGRKSSTPLVPHYALQLPVLGAAWILVGLALARSAWKTSWFRGVLVLLLASVGLLVVMESFSLLWGLPKVYNNLQFPYRLETYIFLAFAGAVVGVLHLLLQTGTTLRRAWTWVLVGVMAWAVIGSALQLRQRPPSKAPEWTHAGAYDPPAFPPTALGYRTNDLPVVTVDPQMPIVRFSAKDAEHGDRVGTTVVASPGAIVRTNLITMPQLVDLRGGRIVGQEPTGMQLVELADDATPGAAKLTISAARPWPVVGGWLLTLLGLAALVANAALIGRAARTRRRARR